MFKDLNLPMYKSKVLVTSAAPHDTVTQGISNTENNHPVRTRLLFDVKNAQPTEACSSKTAVCTREKACKDFERRAE